MQGVAMPDDITHNLTVVREALEAEGLSVHVRLIDAAIEGVASVTEDRDSLQRTFDLQWKADQRAIKGWQEANPGNDLVWPDRCCMVMWLMGFPTEWTVLKDWATRSSRKSRKSSGEQS
jgi:hypothetical protein